MRAPSQSPIRAPGRAARSYTARVGGDRPLATWLLARRAAIDAAWARRLGPRRPAPGTPEAEALRRFRSFVARSLAHGAEGEPALEGLRVDERRAGPLLEAWVEAAAETAGPDAAVVGAALGPCADRFRAALRRSAPVRRASGAPRTGSRRAVAAAIDRVADAFLAVDTDSGEIADANPAAGALLRTPRDALLGAPADRFVAHHARETLRAWLDAVAEGAEPGVFRTALRDAAGRELAVEASVTRFATRRRTLALLVARPRGAEPGPGPAGRP